MSKTTQSKELELQSHISKSLAVKDAIEVIKLLQKHNLMDSIQELVNNHFNQEIEAIYAGLEYDFEKCLNYRKSLIIKSEVSCHV